MRESYKKVLARIYSNNSKIFDILFKIILSFSLLTIISSEIKFPFIFSNIFILIIVSIILGFLHINILAVISTILFLIAAFDISKIAFIYSALIITVVACMFFRYKPNSVVYVLISIVLLKLNIPFLVPALLGIFFTPASILTSFIGTIFYYMIKLPETINKDTDFLNGFIELNNNLFGRVDVLAIILSSAIVICISYFIKKQKNNKMMAINISMIMGELILLCICLIFGNSFDYSSILAFIISVLFANGIVYFMQGSRYKKMEILEYEDDDYYYYVKAMPKLNKEENNKEIDYEKYDSQGYTNDENIGNETREIARDYYTKEE